MTGIEYFQQLSDKKINILKDLYHYRAMTTEQIKSKYFPNSKQYVNKVLHELRRDNFISSKTLSGSRKNKKGLSYHYLTEPGLECLGRHHISVDGHVQNLYVKPSQLNYILLANELVVHLEKSGWEIWDSRRFKKQYNLDSRMNILGLLIAPDGRRYGFYVMEDGILSTTLGRIHAEIRDFYPKIKNYIIFSKGAASYNEFVNKALNPSPKRVGNKVVSQFPIITGYELKVLPFRVGKLFYKAFPTRKDWIATLLNYFGFEIISDRNERNNNGNIGVTRGSGASSITLARQTFDTIVRYKGEEMYFADLTESDLTLLQEINAYNENDYLRENNRKLLVITLSVFQQEWLTKHPFMHHLVLRTHDFEELINKKLKQDQSEKH